ncbi:putative glucosylceramidase 4 [Brevipalpus obovatus]|uniref:putative glucosylceramidase 4 n=1 Tax=Brevipalpus obovatus TaxID=246614 RepID=UPI003D9F1A5B
MHPLTDVIVLLCISINYVVCSDGCFSRHYPGQDSFVCICHQRKCETLPKHLSKIAEHQVVSYESDVKKYRFHKEIIDLASYNDHASRGPKSDVIQIKVDPSQLGGEIFGFGAAFTDAAGINILKLPTPLQDRLMRDYFDQDGLEYTMGRVPIGGTDFSDRNYSLADHPDDFELKHFSLTHDDHLYKIPFIKKARKLSPSLRLMALSWASPGWMKTSKKMDSMGILIGLPGGLYWQLYAKYMIKFLDAYKKEGVEFWAISTGNEPAMGMMPDFSYKALGFSPEMLRDFVKIDLGPALKSAGYEPGEKIKVLMFDDMTDRLETYAYAVLSDPEAAKYVSGIATHWYNNRFPRNYPYDILTQTRKLYPDQFLIMTEACDGLKQGVALGNWTRAENYAIDIIENLNRGVKGWLDWNMALNPQGGPNWSKNYVDATIIINETAKEYYRQPMYYTLAHFTKFLPPRSALIGHTVFNDDPNLYVTTFLDNDRNLIAVILNTNNHPLKLDIEGFTYKRLSITMKAHSIKTLVTKLIPFRY